jgi:hypothetical protein
MLNSYRLLSVALMLLGFWKFRYTTRALKTLLLGTFKKWPVFCEVWVLSTMETSIWRSWCANAFPLGSSALNPVRKELWQMKIPSKIKIFLWRALHGIVPLKYILANRHIGTSGQCPVCLSAPENVMHLLFQCNAAREVWAALGIQNIIDDVISVDLFGSAVLEFLLRDRMRSLPGFNSINLKETIGVTCWYL